MKWTLVSLTALALALPVSPSSAAGPYDGTWVIEAPAAGTSDEWGRPACAAGRFEFQIKNNQVIGSLKRTFSAGGRSGSTVQQGEGRGSSPVTGTVAADGSVTARWESFQATGKLTGDKAQLSWRSPCGPRQATGRRTG